MRIKEFFKNLTSEGEQATVRAVFIGLILTYLFLHRASELALYTCASFFLISSAFLIWIEKHRAKNEARQWLTLVFDICMTTWGLAITGEYGATFVFVYLWLIIGYGLRYGKKFTKGAYILCLTGFGLGVLVSPYWSSNYHLALGYFMMITLIPIHTMRLQGKYDKALEDAKQASKAKSEFLSNMSHDLRTPIAGIVNGVELMEDTEPTLEQDKILYHIKHSSTVLRNLIGDVLDISKIEAGKIEIETEPTSLKSLVEEVHAAFKHQASKKGIKLIINTVGNIDYLELDRKHLKQVIFNLLSNAIKFTDEGSVTFNIEQSGQDDKQVIYDFVFKDTGVGMSEEFVNNIFVKFSRDSSTNQGYEGTGLGTSIAHNLVRLMGGDILVKSEAGVGSEFSFSLSFKKAIERRSVERPTGTVTSLVKHRRLNKQYTILIADDNPTNRFLLKAILNKVDHYQVLEAEDGEKALDLLENNEVHLMMLDLNMPDIDGLEVINMQSSLNPMVKIPAIIITADASLATKDRCLAGGADEVYTKPYETEKLLDLTEHLLEADSDSEKVASITSVEDDVLLVNKQRITELGQLGDHDFLASVIAGASGNVKVLMRAINTAIDENDLLTVNDYIHQMEGTCTNVGFDAILKELVILKSLNKSDYKENLSALSQKVEATNRYVSSNFGELIAAQ